MIKELFDDYERSLKDKEANSFIYEWVFLYFWGNHRLFLIFFDYSVLTKKGFQKKKSSQLKVGDIVQVNPNERIPADMILLYTKYKHLYKNWDSFFEILEKNQEMFS